jgi:hypothetical protein
MKYFKTRGERIYLAISIGFIFVIDLMISYEYYYQEILGDYGEKPSILVYSIELFFPSIFPFVLYTMYKLMFKKGE